MNQEELQKIVDERPGYVIGCIIYTENIGKLPDCNTCGKKEHCEYVPTVGEYARINCPLWVKGMT